MPSGYDLLQTVFQNRLVPDLFARPEQTQVQQAPDPTPTVSPPQTQAPAALQPPETPSIPLATAPPYAQDIFAKLWNSPSRNWLAPMFGSATSPTQMTASPWAGQPQVPRLSPEDLALFFSLLLGGGGA